MIKYISEKPVNVIKVALTIINISKGKNFVKIINVKKLLKQAFHKAIQEFKMHR